MSKAKNTCKTPRATKITIIVLTGAIFVTLISFCVFGSTGNTNASTFRMAAILFRHGEKNPTNFYPNDVYRHLDWKGGLGALTRKGTLQAFKLGTHLQQRYFTLLPIDGIYTQDNMQVLSSYAERCIMSAQALLAGLMPTTEANAIVPLPWQPVPVTSIPRLQDTLIAQKKPCARYEAMLKTMYSRPPPDLERLNAQNAELYKNLTEYTGMNISTVLHVESLYNILKAEEDMGLILPHWSNGIYPERLLPLAERSYTVFTDNDFMKRIKGGAFLSEVHKNMIGKASGTLQPNRNLFLYSGHDVTLVNVMHSMGILDQTAKLPDYASALVFELHDLAITGQYEVKMVYYADGDVKSPLGIEIPNCSRPCDLNKFTRSIAHLLFEDYDEICENPKSC